MSDKINETEKEFEEFAMLVAQAGSAIDLDEAEQIRLSKSIGMELSALALRFTSIEELLAHGAAGYLRRAAKSGDAEAAFELAEIYVHTPNGNGLEDGYEYYQMAADRGHADATFRLACCYLQGAGPTKDYHRAATLFAEAKRLGTTMDAEDVDLDDLSPEERSIMG